MKTNFIVSNMFLCIVVIACLIFNGSVVHFRIPKAILLTVDLALVILLILSTFLCVKSYVFELNNFNKKE